MGLTLSRWHRSSYETDADLAAEVALLGRAGEVLPFEHDAEVIIVTSGRRVDSALLDRVPSARWVLTHRPWWSANSPARRISSEEHDSAKRGITATSSLSLGPRCAKDSAVFSISMTSAARQRR